MRVGVDGRALRAIARAPRGRRLPRAAPARAGSSAPRGRVPGARAGRATRGHAARERGADRGRPGAGGRCTPRRRSSGGLGSTGCSTARTSYGRPPPPRWPSRRARPSSSRCTTSHSSTGRATTAATSGSGTGLARPRRLARRAQRVLTDSDTVRAELLDEWQLPPERVRTVRLGPGRGAPAARRRRRRWRGPRRRRAARARARRGRPRAAQAARAARGGAPARARSAGSGPGSCSWVTVPCAASSRMRVRPCSAGSVSASSTPPTPTRSASRASRARRASASHRSRRSRRAFQPWSPTCRCSASRSATPRWRSRPATPRRWLPRCSAWSASRSCANAWSRPGASASRLLSWERAARETRAVFEEALAVIRLRDRHGDPRLRGGAGRPARLGGAPPRPAARGWWSWTAARPTTVAPARASGAPSSWTWAATPASAPPTTPASS